MKLPEKFTPRLMMTIVGVMLCSLAVGFFKQSMFGVDPFQILSQGSWGHFFGEKMSYGTYYVILNAAMLVLVLVLDKHYVGIATFINLFLTGYIVDFSANTIARFMPEPTLAVRCVFLLIGVLVMCFSASLYMTSDLGVSVYDALPIIASNRCPLPFKYCRIIGDFTCVAIGTICVLLGAVGAQLPGVGTIITAFFMGPLVDFFNRKFSRPLLEKF